MKSLFEQLEEKRGEFRRDIAVFIQERSRKFLIDTGIATQSIQASFVAHQRMGKDTADDVVLSTLQIHLEL